MQVEASWIEGGHMNAAMYFELFVKAGYVLMDGIGLGPTYSNESGRQIFTAEARISYLKEVLEGDTIAIRLRLLGVDHVRVLVLLELLDVNRETVAATMEERFVHVDLRTRRASAIPAQLRSQLDAAVARHSEAPLPKGHKRLLGCIPSHAATP